MAVAVSVAEAATAVALVVVATRVDIAAAQPVEVCSVAVDATEVVALATLLHLAVSDTAVVEVSAAMVPLPLAMAATVAVLAAVATRAEVATVPEKATLLDSRVDTVVSDPFSTDQEKLATVAMAAMVRAPMATVATAWPVATPHPRTSALTSLTPVLITKLSC